MRDAGGAARWLKGAGPEVSACAPRIGSSARFPAGDLGRAGGTVALRRGKGWQAGPAGQWERRGAGAQRREALAGGPAQQAGDARAGCGRRARAGCAERGSVLGREVGSGRWSGPKGVEPVGPRRERLGRLGLGSEKKRKGEVMGRTGLGFGFCLF